MNQITPSIPKWLKSLQENSWELELLISGGAIFFLFQLSDTLINWRDSLRIYISIQGTSALFLIAIIALKFLTLGFGLHLIMRAYWLALVCANNLFPKGIKKEKLHWKKPFVNQSPEELYFGKMIIRIDNYCGAIISISILSTLILAGFLFLFAIYFSFVFITGNQNYFTSLISNIWLISLIIYIVDFLSFGSFRKIPILTYALYPIFTLFDIISLRIHYQQVLHILATNFSKLKFTIAIISFSIIASFFVYLSVYKPMHWANIFDQRKYVNQIANNDYISYSYHKDEHLPNKYYPYYISSKIQKGNFLELFIAYEKKYDIVIDQLPINESTKCFNDIIRVRIDDDELKDLVWFPSNDIKNETGIMSMIPIVNFKNGEHNLYINTIHVSQNIINQTKPIVIPFWIDRSTYILTTP